MDDTDPLSSILLSIPPDFGMSFWISILVLILLLVTSALVSGSEVAFFSLTPEDKEEIRDSADPAAETSLRLLNNPKGLLATILIANNFVNVAIVILSSYIFSQIYPVNPNFIGVDYLRTTIEIGGITFVLLLIGEVIPKVYANRNSLKLVRLMTTPLNVVGKIPPFSWLRMFLVNGTDIILKYARKRQIDVSTDDLENAIALTREEHTTADEQRILEGIVNFGNTDVRQVMRSRVDTIAINEELSYEEVMKLILNSGYSRIPVFKDTFDNVTGILFVKDLLAHLNAPADFEWNAIIRQPFFVPENKKIDDLLKEFQEKKMHMAVVVDEYGGSSGVVTLEDVLEEIIGEITDEFDDEDIVYTKLDDSTYLFEGKTSLVDMYKVLEIDGKAFEEVKGESDSIGGFLIEQSGRILRNNEIYIFENFKFVVESSDKKRVKTIKIIKQ
ncbi:gliding motility-associated protein GldE [Brumimicrobium glaciale]|uniref:Gliding motility-associated protein GldE n=1 Tax=Brumimicrobium glaciale TaxID=200475 RepID=A0A4Q4KHF6_9FLAO|nr:gliding motility-associated protein GldE [Brumimicrobium glaciale]RYM32555.1 gliding motility-associated protein GldE [Brumimicrobium glaciale]